MCEKDLEIIKGDTLTLNINVNNGIDLIEKMFFSSKTLGIQKEAEHFGENVYQIVISSEETKRFNVLQATYDITVVKKNDSISTCIYNGYIFIREKENMLNEY